MTIFLVCTIFCSLQKLIENENNINVTNKRKFINEQDITSENNLINKLDESLNEEPIIKKQKLIENNKNYEDNNHLKRYNYLIFEEFTDINNESNDSLNNINESLIINNDVEYRSCDNANNFEKIFSINDVCNNEDFIYYCNQFSLELLDNINYNNNNDISRISAHKEKKDEKDVNLNFTHELNKKNNEIFFNISNDDIKKYANSYYFIKVFDIIFQDLLNILKNCTLVLKIKNEQIKNYIVNLEQQKNYEQRILAFIKVTNEMLNENINIASTPNNEKNEIIVSILKDARNKYIPSKTIQTRLFRKRCLLINQIKKNKITYKDVFDFIIENLKLMIDDDIRTVCIYGLTNIFFLNSEKIFNKLLNKSILLFIFNNEKSDYYINWIEKFITYLSDTNGGINVLTNFNLINDTLFKNTRAFYSYKLYIAMNTINIDCLLRIYLEIQKDTFQLEFINNLIDVVNKIKCRMLNIKYIKKIDHLE